ncbi:hypothetical protein D3C81_710220 [compost metagenome]
MLALRVQFRVFAGDAVHGQAVEDAEFLFAQALVGHHGIQAVRIEACQHGLRRLVCSHIRRIQHHGRLLFRGEGGEPVAQGLRLARAQFRERDIDIALGDGDEQLFFRFGGIARHVAGTLAVTHDPQLLRPFLFHRLAPSSAFIVNKYRRKRQGAARRWIFWKA